MSTLQPSSETPPAGSWKTKGNTSGATANILLLGPRGCGKTTLINFAANDFKQLRITNFSPTKEFRLSSRCLIGDQKIKFIDSPGFADPAHVKDTLLKLVEYLGDQSQQRLPMRLAGIIYVHPATDDLRSQTLQKNLRLLSALIGEDFLDRVTILAWPQTSSTQPEATFRQSIMSEGSPFHSFYSHVQDPKVHVYKLDRRSFEEMVRPYASLGPQRFFAQDKTTNFTQSENVQTWSIEDVAKHLQAELDQDAEDSKGAQLAKQPVEEKPKDDTQLSNSVHPQGERTKKDNNSSLEEQCKESVPDLDINTPESAYKDQIRKLNDRLEQIQAKYASLRSHLQDRDTAEHGQITQTFSDINRLIEELGQSISEHIVDNFAGDLAPIQDLEPSRFQKLSSLFGHQQHKPSLIRSSGGSFPDLEDFLFYAIRAILCEQLYKRLFKPFHPSLADKEREVQNDFIEKIYKQMIHQEPQSVAGRWRKDSFNSISKSSSYGSSTCVQTIHHMIVDSLCLLIGIFVDAPKSELVLGEHQETLIKLISTAESWNQSVKGGVVFHGDFQAVAYPYGGDFISDYMTEPKKKSNRTTGHPEVKSNLATIELGLIKYFAVGNDKEPQVSVLRKAVVVSEGLLFQ